jgi:hypothetical protein
MNALIILVIIVLVCVAVDIVNLLITMQLMARIGDLAAEVVFLPSMEVKKDAALTELANLHGI